MTSFRYFAFEVRDPMSNPLSAEQIHTRLARALYPGAIVERFAEYDPPAKELSHGE
jgi:hypothetical protein